MKTFLALNVKAYCSANARRYVLGCNVNYVIQAIDCIAFVQIT
jgi:hypothetical protein